MRRRKSITLVMVIALSIGLTGVPTAIGGSTAESSAANAAVEAVQQEDGTNATTEENLTFETLILENVTVLNVTSNDTTGENIVLGQEPDARTEELPRQNITVERLNVSAELTNVSLRNVTVRNGTIANTLVNESENQTATLANVTIEGLLIHEAFARGGSFTSPENVTTDTETVAETEGAPTIEVGNMTVESFVVSSVSAVSLSISPEPEDGVTTTVENETTAQATAETETTAE